MILANRGPVVQVAITVAEQVATQLVQQGIALQPPIAGWALIDTGASTTCVDEDAAKTLKLPVIDVVQMSSASHASHPANVYPVQLRIAGLPNPINAPRAIGAALKAQDLVALIGRDMLSMGTLFFNGVAGQITLSL
jgi:predicted aspartyl protease